MQNKERKKRREMNELNEKWKCNQLRAESLVELGWVKSSLHALKMSERRMRLSLHHWNQIAFFSLSLSLFLVLIVHVMISHIAGGWHLRCQHFRASNGKEIRFRYFPIFRSHWHVKYDFSAHRCERKSYAGSAANSREKQICHRQFQTAIIQKRMRYHKPIITEAPFIAETRKETHSNKDIPDRKKQCAVVILEQQTRARTHSHTHTRIP